MYEIPLKREHLDLFYENPPTMRGIAVEHEGRIIGLAGVYTSFGKKVLLSQITDELRKHPIFLFKTAVKLMKTLGKVYAFCDDLEAAPRFLARLGFEPLKGDIWVRP